MKKIILLSIFIALSSPAVAYWRCDGLIASNNSCIGSETNVESYNNHEPFYTDGGNRQLGDALPRRPKCDGDQFENKGKCYNSLGDIPGHTRVQRR
jgi:hypothetical protein